jgi:hypothetical protein
MRNVCILAAAIAIVASPAFAQSRKSQPQRPPQAAPYDAYGGQSRRGTDPDPNVQFDIMRQQNWSKG